MNWKTPLIALAFGAAAATMAAQETKTTTRKETTTQQNPDGSTKTTTRTTTVTGSVVQFTPGQTIVLKNSDGTVKTYAIGSALEVPAEVQVGKSITITTEPASDGSGPA